MGGIEQKFCLFLQSSQSELKILNEKLSTELLHKDQRLFLGMYHLGICDPCSYYSCIILTSQELTDFDTNNCAGSKTDLQVAVTFSSREVK